MIFKKVKFQNREFIVENLENSAITTPEDYAHGLVSFAHLYPNGEIKQYGDVIGTKDDLEIIGEIEVKEADNFLAGVLGPSWPWNEEN